MLEKSNDLNSLELFKLKEKSKKRKAIYYIKNRELFLLKRKEYREKNPDKVKLSKKKSTLKSKYGVVYEDYLSMHIEQEYKCKICDRHENNFKHGLTLDHDHKTGKPRGLLCPACNSFLHVIENKEFYDKAVKYLNEYKEE